MKLEFFAVLWWHEGIHFSVIQSFSVSTDRSKEHVTVMGNPCIVLIPAFLLLNTHTGGSDSSPSTGVLLLSPPQGLRCLMQIRIYFRFQ